MGVFRPQFSQAKQLQKEFCVVRALLVYSLSVQESEVLALHTEQENGENRHPNADCS